MQQRVSIDLILIREYLVRELLKVSNSRSDGRDSFDSDVDDR